MFITLEGIDGAGKTTQLYKLASLLTQNEYNCITTGEPWSLFYKEQMEKAESLTERLFLFLADRAAHVRTVIKPALQSGCVVLCDRYIDSTFAYQGYAEHWSLPLLEELNAVATGGLMPDITFWLKLPPELALQRCSSQKVWENLNLVYLQAVHTGYEAIAETYSNRIITVDASLPTDLVTQIMYSYICQRMT